MFGVRGLGLDFVNLGGIWGKWDMCLCFGCGGVGGVRVSGWVAWARVWEGGVLLCLCIFCVALLMYLFYLFVACLIVFVICLAKQFALCLGVVAVLLLNVMDVFSVGGGDVLCWIDRVWSSTECVCCPCDPSVHLSVSYICFVCVFVCRKLFPH